MKTISIATTAAVTCDTNLTTILSTVVNGMMDAIGFELNNTGSAALTDFQIQFQLRLGGAWKTAIAAADLAAFIAGTTPFPAFLLGVWTNPATLAASGSAGFLIQPAGIYAIRFQGKSGTTTTVTLSGSGRSLAR